MRIKFGFWYQPCMFVKLPSFRGLSARARMLRNLLMGLLHFFRHILQKCGKVKNKQKKIFLFEYKYTYRYCTTMCSNKQNIINLQPITTRNCTLNIAFLIQYTRCIYISFQRIYTDSKKEWSRLQKLRRLFRGRRFFVKFL